MAGMQFEYDEKGGTFYYFLLSFFALVLFPATYYWWPRGEDKEDNKKTKRQCHCEKCQMKKQLLRSYEPYANLKKNLIKGTLFVAWILFLLVAYKTSQVELDFTEYDPFKELEIHADASTAEIKKAYRKLSLLYHPDRETGDPKKFMRIAKAYAALTDEESRKNWREHGNPDGPGATHFGIALPKWIIEKQNSVWVLAVYGLVFMVILPVVVGTWWYKSIKFSGDQVLLDTQRLYYIFFNKTPNMMLKRVVMILAGSMEFEKGHNNEIIERPSDNEELPALFRDLPHLNEKNKERPLCYPYSVKSRALLHAHFSRVELPPKTLEVDRQYIVKKCPYLINEMVNMVAVVVAHGHAGQVSHIPRLDTIENCMKVGQMVVQALWENKSPLLQLPHISENMLRHFVTRKRNIRSIKQLVSMKEEDRRALLRSLTDDEYRDVLNVISMMPNINMEVTSEVLDDEDKTITAGSIVTVSVRLTRSGLDTLFSDERYLEKLEAVEDVRPQEEPPPPEECDEHETEPQKSEAEVEEISAQKSKPKGWEKQQKKKKGKGGKSKKPKPRQPYVRKPAGAAQTIPNGTPGKDESKAVVLSNGDVDESKPKKATKLTESDEEASDLDTDDQMSEGEADENLKGTDGEGDNEEDDWMKFQEESKKENSLETKSKESHIVHCPFFPSVKQEWWWLYVADRKNRQLITAPVQICSLKDEEEVQLKFTAPMKVGSYQYTVILRSDSYLDFDLFSNMRLDVQAAKEVESHPQWEKISDDDDEKAHAGSEDSDDMSSDEESDEEEEE